MGYTGGTLKDPTYHHLGDHTESVQLDYDPSRVSYEQLLDIFWRSHNAFGRTWSRQYMSAIFYHDSDQLKLSRSASDREAARSGSGIATEILPVKIFYPAEDYHQKYHLRQHALLLREFERMYPQAREMVDSTAATRINGYLGGEGTFRQLQKEINGFGLSPTAAKTLLSMIQQRG